jgi:hypothetical protein
MKKNRSLQIKISVHILRKEKSTSLIKINHINICILALNIIAFQYIFIMFISIYRTRKIRGIIIKFLLSSERNFG